ncbi:c-type cytochrome [Membranicola marinus]|uniref:C-type cytochrome n=1 Tax=Membranihabitans marinus TaxID=1227546 RepID=A0A953HQ11_9BACT|nr:PVC-type heme-binding CxxCH protein [Membranihabitans marinus]MBY5959662.1 c-type cytochrome [Membranihabitans marinus]
MSHNLQIILFAGFFLSLFISCGQPDITYEHGAISPQQGLQSYEVAEGFQIELFASEPLIADPVDMAVDENGVMYVVEMSGYPLDKSHTGKVKILRDTDGDGTMDESILFADELMFPNGIMPWKKGVMITDAPHVLYLEDVDGDGRADVRDTLLTGFSLSNPHVNVNNPIYGLDNWIYLSHFGRIGTRKYEDEFGDLGEEIRFWNQERGPRLPQNANSRNVRFKVDGHSLEMRSVKGQFGHDFDEWGHHFLTHNQNHIYQEVLAPQYLHRNPDAVISTAAEDVSDHGNSAEVFQITTNPDRQLFTPVGLTTSSSGLVYYSGGLFPPPYDTEVAFGAESVSNLVHVDKLTPNGAAYTGSRLEEDKEFLASRDSWARPVNMYVGPDGALYVLDYYRRIIEHPEWMSDEAIEDGDLYDGHNMGRIYRISPEGYPAAQWTKGLDLGQKSDAELVQFLSHQNRWWRSHAQRMLVNRKNLGVVPLLKQKVRSGKMELGRLHALWTLEGLHTLEKDDIHVALQDESSGIRENAIRLAERTMKNDAELRESLYGIVRDSSAQVRFQLLNTLGELVSDKAQSIREEILFHDIEDEWVQRSALSARRLDVKGLLEETVRRSNSERTSKYDAFISRLTEVLGASQDSKLIVRLLRQGIGPEASEAHSLQPAILKGLASGLKRNENNNAILFGEAERLVNVFFNHTSDEVRKYTFDILKTMSEDETPSVISKEMARAVQRSQDKNLPVSYRIQMLNFLTLGAPENFEIEIKSLIVPSQDPSVQTAALKVYDIIPGTAVSEYVLKHWEEMTSTVRDEALSTFMRSQDRVKMLLHALESGTIPKSELGWTRTVRLNQYHDESLRKRARTFLAEDDLEEVIASFQPALNRMGQKEKGLELYKTHCAICHQVRGKVGVEYGPDLGTVHNWEAKALMANILDPGLSIAPGYDLWEIDMQNGTKLQGMIRSETSSALELQTGPDSQTTINRQDVKKMQSIPGMSMMPGFGNTLSHDEMADLIAYLRDSG